MGRSRLKWGSSYSHNHFSTTDLLFSSQLTDRKSISISFPEFFVAQKGDYYILTKTKLLLIRSNALMLALIAAHISNG